MESKLLVVLRLERDKMLLALVGRAPVGGRGVVVRSAGPCTQAAVAKVEDEQAEDDAEDKRRHKPHGRGRVGPVLAACMGPVDVASAVFALDQCTQVKTVLVVVVVVVVIAVVVVF